MRIDIVWLGPPRIEADGAPVRFKYQKAEAIFYYIAYHRSAERYRIMNLFWPEATEDKARKNLRNALYSIRQAFDREVLVNDGQRLIRFAPDLELHSDLEAGQPPDGSEKEFLQDFSVRDAAEFDEWVQLTRTRIRDRRIAVLEQALRDCLSAGGDPEPLCREMMALDPYDERTVRVLMAHYGRNGQFSRTVELYTQLCRTLEEELSLKPEPETVKVFEQSIETRRNLGKAGKNGLTYFYGRTRELERMDGHLNRLMKLGEPGLVLITGEAGIGKSTLLKWYLMSLGEEGWARLGVGCYEGDQQHLLKPWFPLILRLGELLTELGLTLEEYRKETLARVFPAFLNTSPGGTVYEMEKQQQIPFPVIVEGVTALLRRIADRVPLIIFLEDLQWMDDWSLALLRHLVFDPERPAVIYLATSRLGGKDLYEQLGTHTGKHENSLILGLNRFTRAESEGFIDMYPGRPALSDEMKSLIHTESEGNPLMLTEILRGVMEQGALKEMPTRIRNAMESRYLGLGQEARKLADLLSVFSESADWNTLRSLYGKPDLDLLETLEELLAADFIRETESETREIRYRFTHQKLKSMVYERQSLMKRRMLHKRVAEHHLNQLTGGPSDRMLYPYLIHHFERSGDQRAFLEFRIRSLYESLEIRHELFPRIRDRSIMESEEGAEAQTDLVAKEIRDIETAMQTLGREEGTLRLRLEYLNLVGRYHILQGDSEAGAALIHQMIRMAETAGEGEFALKGYLQLVYNAINQRSTHEMEHLLGEAFRQFRHNADKAELGILIRLKGYLMILKDRFSQGETLLQNAAAIFERPEYRDQYALNLVASYYYVGESRRLQNDFLGADAWYSKAEEVCRRQGFGSHLALMMSSRGIAAYDCGRYDDAFHYLGLAVPDYDRSRFKWGQIAAYGYWSLLCLRRGMTREAHKYLRLAELHTKQTGHAYELGLMLRIKAELCCLRRQGFPMAEIPEALCGPENRFCQQAIAFFEERESFTYERKILRDIRQICDGCLSYQG